MSRLPNAPLQEVIFEIRWALVPGKETGQIIDEGFELASGRLSTIIEQEFPHYKRIIPQDIPDQLMHYQVIHQYWSGENRWPVIQLGPGIFTINCTDEGYDWEGSFQKLIKQAIGWLEQSYKQSLNIRFASLRYIDGIRVDDYGGIDGNWQNFIKTNFNFEYNNHFNTRGSQKQIQVNQTFELEDGSDLQLQIANGARNNEKALVWQTAILKKDSFDFDKLVLWANYAHDIAHDLFQEMIKPDLYASFSRKNKN
jgi:uncharacterized protein (TIGR04255 family)